MCHPVFFFWKQKNISEKSTENPQYILCTVNFPSENRAFYEKMWENMIKPERPKITDNMAHENFMLDN